MSTQQVIDKCKEVFARAKILYGVDCSKVDVRLDLTGRVGAQAGDRGYPQSYFVRFNYDMVVRETEEMVETVVPHEIAHIVCYMRPDLGKNHDQGWARVCRELGGTGDRTHDMDVVYSKGTTYEYITDRGHKVRLNDRRHAIIQRGSTLKYRKGKGTVSISCAYSIVGRQGRTLAEPIVKKAAETKERPVSTFFIGAPEVVKPLVKQVYKPVAQPQIVQPAPAAGESKAAVSRRIMLTGYQAGRSYEAIITSMMLANGYTRQLARATYLANAPKIGIPL